MNYKKMISGPVIPVPTFFNEDESVDFQGLSKYVSFLSDSRIPAIMTTVGTSRYNLLSWDEIKENNKTLSEFSSGITQSIVANPTTGGLKTAIEFGKHAESINADYFLVYFPERYYGEDNTFSFFKELSEELEINILVHEMPMRNGIGGGSIQYSITLLEKLFSLNNIVGMKEESLDVEYSNKLVETFSDDVIIIGAGGGMGRFLNRDFERGSKAFLGGIGNFIPQMEIDFYNYLTSGDIEKAKNIVEKVEMKYFEKVVPLGWHPSLKIAMNLKGFSSLFERRPMKQFLAEEINIMKGIFKEFNW
jgi:4-hydroxy-tetrahydrodipicolinate synthase